jgi:hypothetical protein
LIAKYADANGGRFLPVDTARRANFKTWAANTTEAGYNAALPVIQNYRDWFNNEFISSDDQSCSNAM